jgi:hypothetical protein
LATLVFSTVGTALGGPLGGAIGALIGQSIDHQLLAPATRGPRLGDLAVQTSSYGTQIPRVYGTMRVAGSVIWSTDLVESSQTAGAKGQPDVTYSYSASFAVALSSRPIKSIGRIWADGNLLRGAAGDFKSSTTFRLYDGSEDQAIDPLIGSIEGIANTPAFRGVALALFEKLELADFGNRIPFLTFEVVADDEPPSVTSILADASGGAIAGDAADQIAGYAAYGASVRAAIQPLVDCYGLDLFDDGAVVRSPLDMTPLPIDADQLGNSADNQQASRLKREQLPSRSVPASLRLSYYDPSRDFQTGEARASAGEPGGDELRQQLPGALSAADAKSLAQIMLARMWGARDSLTLRLPPSSIGLEPGARLQLSLQPANWVVDTCTIDSFVGVVDARPAFALSAALPADAGRIVASSDIVEGPISLSLFDVPDVLGQLSVSPTILLAASTPTAGWRRHPIELSFGGQTIAVAAPRRKSILGSALVVLPLAGASLIDNINTLDVQLIDADQWLTSCDDDALAAGANLAVLGTELLQFGAATSLSNGRWRLSRLLRGRAGTEWALDGHRTGDQFCLIAADSLQPLTLPAWVIGSDVTVQSSSGSAAALSLSAESLRPPSPVGLSAVPQQGGGISASWTRRSRAGWAWTDEVDAPLGETREQYRVTITGADGSVEAMADQPTVIFPQQDLPSAGAGPAMLEVRQIGDWAVSRPAQLPITLS